MMPRPMAIWGDREQGFHATQLACYALTVLALGGLLVRWGLRRDLAWLATLLWAIHPIHVESVAWLSERKGVLAGLFAVGEAAAGVREGGERAQALILQPVGTPVPVKNTSSLM